jgi:hypothetical protein
VTLRHDAFAVERTVTSVDGKLSPKNMRGKLAQARPVTFSVAATAAGYHDQISLARNW